VTHIELKERLAALEQSKKTAQSQLKSISPYRRRLVELEANVEELVHQYSTILPEALDTLSTEKKHQIYKTLRMKAMVGTEGSVAVEFVLGLASDSDAGSVKAENLCS
jgi:hypothetical protein